MIPGHKGNGAQKRCVQLQKVHKQRLAPSWLTFYTVPLLTFRFFLLYKNFQFSFVIVDALVFKKLASRFRAEILICWELSFCFVLFEHREVIMKWHSQIDLRTQEIKNWDIWDHKSIQQWWLILAIFAPIIPIIIFVENRFWNWS